MINFFIVVSFSSLHLAQRFWRSGGNKLLIWLNFIYCFLSLIHFFHHQIVPFCICRHSRTWHGRAAWPFSPSSSGWYRSQLMNRRKSRASPYGLIFSRAVFTFFETGLPAKSTISTVPCTPNVGRAEHVSNRMPETKYGRGFRWAWNPIKVFGVSIPHCQLIPKNA